MKLSFVSKDNLYKDFIELKNAVMSTFQTSPRQNLSTYIPTNTPTNFNSFPQPHILPFPSSHAPLIPGNLLPQTSNLHTQSQLQPSNVPVQHLNNPGHPLLPSNVSVKQESSSLTQPKEIIKQNNIDVILNRPEPSQDELMKSYKRDQKRKEKQHSYYLKRKEKLHDAEKLSQMVSQLQVENLNLKRQLAEKDNIIAQYQRSPLNK